MKRMGEEPPYEIKTSGLKRLALFSGNYNYVMDGPVRALNQLVAFLERQGIEVLVFAPTTKKPAFQHNGTLISVPSFAIPGRQEYRMALGMPAHIRKTLEDFKPDLVHLSAPDFLGSAALDWANLHGVPAVSSFHTRFDTYPRYYGMPWAEKYLTNHMRQFYHRCEHVYVPSQSMIDVLKEQGMARSNDDLRIWSRGVDTTIFNPQRRDMAWRRSLGIQDNEVVINFVGRLVLEKGLGVFADVIDSLNARGLPFKALIVGEGPERQRFQERLKDAVFTGFLSGEELARAYASSDIFFNASITETFGNVTLEAMASRIPSVCANATGSRTLVADGTSGYLVDYNDLNGFADKLTKLVTDTALRDKMASAAYDRSREYTWDAILASLLGHYIEALNSYNRAERVWQAENRRRFPLGWLSRSPKQA